MPCKVILLVDDNPDDIALTEAAIAQVPVALELHVAEDGEAALEHLSIGAQPGASGPRPDLILLDLKLPGIDGFEVLRRIRSSADCSLIPIVVLTSSVVERDILTSYQLGANSYIRKSVDFDAFVLCVEQLIRYWLELNQPPPAENNDEPE